MRHVLVVAFVLAAAPVGAADKAAVKAKAVAVVKTGQKALQTGQLPAGAAELKSKGAAALGSMPADAAKALKAAKGQTSFTPEQLSQIQAQAGQAFSAVTSDPRAAAVAASVGVTPQTLNAVQAQTAAAVAGFKGADGKPSVEAAGQQAREFMASEKAAQLSERAGEAAARAGEDPKFNAAALKFKTEAGAALAGAKAKAPVVKESVKAALTPENARLVKDRAATAAADPGVRAGAAAFQTNAQKALIKFCKKYEGKTAVPARCRKPKHPVEVE